METMTIVESRVGVSTITWARSPGEGQIIIDSLKSLSSMGLPIVVTDGGSPTLFIQELRLIPHLFLTAKPDDGLFPQIKKSLTEAAKKSYPYILYTEADKLDFFKKGLREFLRQADDIINSSPNAGVIVASRTPRSFSTFPPFQRFGEETINQLLHFYTQDEQGVDYTYGPRIIHTSLISTLDKAPNDLGWGWLSFILLASQKLGKKVHNITLDFPCPENERGETEKDRLYRLTQFKDHVNALHIALSTEFL